MSTRKNTPTKERGRYAPLVRCLRVLRFLIQHRYGCTIPDMAEEEGISIETAYRYMKALKDAGVDIQKTDQGWNQPKLYTARSWQAVYFTYRKS